MGPYEFGPFHLDPARRLLLRHGSPVPLTAKTFDTLLLLVEHNGELISKDKLMTALWSDSHVDEANITQTVFMVRRALGESAGHQQYLVTVPGRGYRFTADVRRLSPDGIPTAIKTAATTVEPEPPPNTPTFRLAPIILIAAFTLTAAAIAVRWYHSSVQAPASGGKTVLAVLPFENLTGDAGQDYFSDGLTEEMIIQLERLDPQHLEVIASTSAAGDQDRRSRLQKIGEQLGVQYLLEGSVRRESNKVRISAKLVRRRQQTYLWAKQYDRELTNVLSVQSEIAHNIADEIQSTVGDGQTFAKPVIQPALSRNEFDVYDLYLKGRYFWNKRTPQGLQQAIACFQQATQKNSSYARAYAGLADSYALYSGYSLSPANEIMPKAREAASRALAIDDKLAEAHASLAVIAQDYDWDWKTAEKEYKRAIQLDPNYATAHHWYAEYLGLQGRFDEAFTEIDRARRLDPLSLIMAADNAAILLYAHQYDRAIQQFRAVLEMEPNFPRAHMLVYAYVQRGMFAEAVAEVDKWRSMDDDPRNWPVVAYVYGRAGHLTEARGLLTKLEHLYQQQQMDPVGLFLAYVGTDDKEAAFTWLEKAYTARSSDLNSLKVNPIYDPLR
ncbi:MAG TPA: winged helix-turn-helix domain-containing protein, partial [Bryobacteraceae bacterium]|nr:winged helix-turn-helix domain-containing protein [Bryobacteraceae bacterium]